MHFIFTWFCAVHHYISLCDSRVAASLACSPQSVISSSHCPREQCEGGKGIQQQSCPCQLDPTHPPSGKRVSCVLHDISTLFISWKNGVCCRQGGDWWPWPNNKIYLYCGHWHRLLVYSDHGSAAKGSAVDLEVTGSGLVGCCFSFISSFFTMCSLLPCLSLVSPWYVDHLH